MLFIISEHMEKFEKYYKILEDSSFTPAESKVYVNLLKNPDSKSGNIIKETGLQSSVVHNTLNSLIEKGFAKYILRNKIKHYTAENPVVIERFLENKRKRFSEISNELINISSTRDDEMRVETYSGINGILIGHEEFIKDAELNDILKMFADMVNFENTEALNCFLEILKINENRNIETKKIANTNNRDFVKTNGIRNIKLTPQKVPTAISVFKDKVMLFNFSGDYSAIIISSKEYAKQYHKLFNEIWG